jgi:hypothetical protein
MTMKLQLLARDEQIRRINCLDESARLNSCIDIALLRVIN